MQVIMFVIDNIGPLESSMTHRITILHVASNGDLERPQPSSKNFLGSFVLSTELKSATVKKLSKAHVSSVSP